MADKFNVFGMPENEEFEPKKTTNKSFNSGRDNPMALFKFNLDNIDDETLSKMFTETMRKMGVNGGLPDSKNIMNILNEFMSASEECESSEDCSTCKNKRECTAENAIYYIIDPDDPKLLTKEAFKSVKYIRDPNFSETFKAVFDTDTERTMITALSSPVTEPIFRSLDKIVPIYIDDTHAILRGICGPDDNSDDVALIAVETESGKFTYIMPMYGNTFSVDSETNDVEIVTDFDEDYLNDAFNWICYEDKNAFLTTPHQFGMIKNSRQPIIEPTDFVRIGTIKSNGSPEANLFIKDAELDEHKTEFPIYVKLNTPYDVEMLQQMTEAWFHYDFNTSEYLDTVELKYTNDKKLYFEINV